MTSISSQIHIDVGETLVTFTCLIDGHRREVVRSVDARTVLPKTLVFVEVEELGSFVKSSDDLFRVLCVDVSNQQKYAVVSDSLPLLESMRLLKAYSEWTMNRNKYFLEKL